MTTDELIALQGQITPEPWKLETTTLYYDEADVAYAVSKGEKGRKVGDVFSVTITGLNVFSIDHDHWLGSYLSGEESDFKLASIAPDLLAEVIRLRAFLDDLATAKVETIPRRRRDPQDDEPDMMEADTFYAWQEDARAILVGKAGA